MFESQNTSFLGHTLGSEGSTASPAVQEIFNTIDRVAQTQSSVLIFGESGTGKELIARTIHEKSNRVRGAWVAVNCANLTSEAIEADLFGTNFSTGKLTAAQGGTLFLEEVSELPLHIQQKLMKVLDSNALDIRMISSTSQALEPMVANKLFSQELFYKLSIVPIKVPSLRDRKAEIPGMVKTFVEKVNRLINGNVACPTGAVMDSLCAYAWPGNVKELESVIERLVIVKGAGTIEANDLPSKIYQGGSSVAGAMYAPESEIDFPRMFLPEKGVDLKNVVASFENHLVDQALSRTSGNKNRASMLLGLNRTTLVEKLRKRGMITPLKSIQDARHAGASFDSSDE